MTQELEAWDVLRPLTWRDAALIVGIVVAARLVWLLSDWLFRQAAEKGPARLRLPVLRVMPIVHLAIGIAAVMAAVPLLVEPTVQNIVVLLASVGLVLAFGLKDYGSSLIAGVAAVVENAYQPGDWIEVNGVYGEVKAIGLRAVRVVTADDSEVVIPHGSIWSGSVINATSGGRALLCVAEFYLDPDHDAAAARRRLAEVGEASRYRKPDTPVKVIVQEKPWGTGYRLKAYVKESREQFEFITDLTVRGKEALRGMGFRFARAPYAAASRG